MKSIIIYTAILLLLSQSKTISQYSWQDQFSSLPPFAFPVELVHADDGTNRFIVVQQRGIIYVFENIPGVSTRKVFLNLSDLVSQSGNETGLLGFAFHPNYPDSGYFYLNYTSNSTGSLRSYIARYTVSSQNPDSALRESEVILLSVDQPYNNHNGGTLVFGPDGYLYIGFGDGGSGNDPNNRAQDRTVILGKILRIDVDRRDAGLLYAIPPENPYYRSQLGYREEIFAYGIRNPWKFSFDRVTGLLWLGDVGQDTREEVDIVINGGNYGWRLKEGFICNPVVNPACQDTAGLLPPVWDYPNLSGAGNDGSITGGYVYRGSVISSLYGKYIFADYVSGKTWALTYNGVPPQSVLPLSDESYLISTFGTDTEGNMYLCSYGSSGRIYKLTEQTAGASDIELAPAAYKLFQNYPNPFNPSTTIPFSLSTDGNVNLSIYNTIGEEITVLAEGYFRQGVHSSVWNAAGYASGVYIARLSFVNKQQNLFSSSHKKLLLMK
ncbi:MAG: T9SS C-terminal target domain-containing protein [Ignavibacteriae bacterium]|nr:MAG: T9SS C-terminal target domain-containing protein [Ignavibacteriota bacterium]